MAITSVERSRYALTESRSGTVRWERYGVADEVLRDPELAALMVPSIQATSR